MHRRDSYSKYKEDRRHPSRKRRRSPSPQASSSSKEKPPDLQAIININRHHFSSFLQNHLNVGNADDFWKFFEKYQTIQAHSTDSANFDKTNLLNVNFDRSPAQLYNKLPVNVPEACFAKFLNSVLVYQDFQQKSKFSKLRKLRRAQSDLPIAQYKRVLIEMLERNRVVLVAGDTGCGKSTQVPQYVLEAGYKKIVCTQPRRIACISLAKRVAYETLTDYKTVIGYQIRFV
uniref:Helicase ATP-binding domain-containing protein n=1 Tax=Photinus pyralis TaxID=7054 RepID=A0A1Y1MY84_PHOPY